MTKPQLPEQETARSDALHQYEILDTPPETVFDDLVSLAAHVCRTPIALINFIDRNRQWFKASIGWTIPELPENVGFCCHAIRKQKLLIVPDACQDSRFANNSLVTSEPHIRFYAGVPLITPAGQAIGTLCVMDQQSRTLDLKQAEALSTLARQVIIHLESRRQLIDTRDITDRQRAEEELRSSNERFRQIQASLKEKEVLLKEIHHRVKNNLQVISSLLNLQSGYIKDQQALESFKESQSRIKTIALLHENLYQSKNLSQIKFAEYVQQLTVSLFRAYGVNSSAISLKIHIEDILLNVDTAIPCGLIINELVSNCIKYAFPTGKFGEICISLISVTASDNKLILTVRDNGVGFPKHINFRNPESLGLQLVNILADQLKGTVELNCNGITEFKIKFIITGSQN